MFFAFPILRQGSLWSAERLPQRGCRQRLIENSLRIGAEPLNR